MNALTKLWLTSMMFLSICANTYGVESKFSASYRCESDFKGGVNHSADGHRVTQFSGRLEFRVTHINDLKKSTHEQWPHLSNLHSAVDMEDYSWFYEERAHFFRSTEVPESNILFSPACTSSGEKRDGVNITTSISCKDSNYLFRFTANNGSFVYAYLGSYDPTGGEKAEKYYGDSSVFAYGTCKPYYD